MYSVIIVDDEINSANIISNYIAAYFSDTFTVSAVFDNAVAAMEFMSKNSIQLVITDIKMPVMDGLEFSRLIKKSFPMCEIIIISGYGNFEYAKNAIKYNVSSYILKPIDFTELNECIAKAGESLDRKFLIFNDVQSDKSETFFFDLFFGDINSEQEYTVQLNELRLPFSVNEYCGDVIKLTLGTSDAMNSWRYDKDSFENLALNILRFTIPNTKIFLITKKSLDFYFVIFRRQNTQEVDFCLPIASVKDILCIDVSIETILSFSTLKDVLSLEKDYLVAKNIHNDFNRQQMKKAIDFISENFYKDISRDDVSSFVYMSPGYFSYNFKKETGMTFQNYLINLRIENAISLLLNSKLSISEIAVRSGFNSKNSFLYNFKIQTGYTPTEYKRLYTKDEPPCL